MIEISARDARRIAISAQRLAGPRPPASPEEILEIFRALGCIQIDPIRAVERTQLLVLWSRLGPFDPAILSQLQSEEKTIFEAWAHCASLVRTEDYPLFHFWSRAEKDGGGVWGERVRKWMAANEELRLHVIERLRSDGPLATNEFEDLAAVPWESTGWSKGRNVARMLDFLYDSAEVLTVGRKGNQRLWHLTDAWLPETADHTFWEEAQVVRRAAAQSLLSLGVADGREIKNHFMRKRYPDLETRLEELVEEEVALPVQVHDGDGSWPGQWYLHKDHRPLLDHLDDDDWGGRTVFLSPFDNLICDRARTERLFDFYFRIEIYVPKAKREYGYYVLPLLSGDRFIGRMDSKLDRKSGIYCINAIYPETEADGNQESGTALAQSLKELVDFIGAARVELGDEIPAAWRSALQSALV